MKTRIVQKQFKRKETKYIVNMDVFVEFEKELRQHMTEDEFATSTITNIYFDNEDFDMIQDSLAKKSGREKIGSIISVVGKSTMEIMEPF